jgi:hypothetical protein
MRKAWYMAHTGEKKYAYRVLVRKSERNRDKHRWKCKTKMSFK